MCRKRHEDRHSSLRNLTNLHTKSAKRGLRRHHDMASDTPSEMIGIDTFAQRLDQVLSSILDDVKERQATVGMPLQVDKAWIMRRVREQVSEDGYTIAPKSAHNPNGLGPFFTKLPRELRDMIFADCLASGHPQFMASSRAMRMEGLSQIFKKGVFRMNFGIMVRMSLNSVTMRPPWECPRPTQDTLNRIQHLSIQVKPTARRCRDFWSNIDYDVLKLFTGSEVPRKSCKILFGNLRGGPNLASGIFYKLRKLTGFEVVEVRIGERWDGLRHTDADFEFCGRLLSPGLGVGVMGQDEDDSFMRFSPRRA